MGGGQDACSFLPSLVVLRMAFRWAPSPPCGAFRWAPLSPLRGRCRRMATEGGERRARIPPSVSCADISPARGERGALTPLAIFETYGLRGIQWVPLLYFCVASAGCPASEIMDALWALRRFSPGARSIAVWDGLLIASGRPSAGPTPVSSRSASSFPRKASAADRHPRGNEVGRSVGGGWGSGDKFGGQVPLPLVGVRRTGETRGSPRSG